MYWSADIAETCAFTHRSPMTDLAERVLTARKKAGLTQGALAHAVGLRTVMAISNIENRATKQPKIETLRKIAEVTGVDFDWLVKGLEESAEDHWIPDQDPKADPVLQEFLATEAGQRCTPEEVTALALIPRRLGRAKDASVYVALLSLLRHGFSGAEAQEMVVRKGQEREMARAKGFVVLNRSELEKRR